MAITKEATNDDIDLVLRPAMWSLLEMLVGSGVREPRQAIQDLRRSVEQCSDRVEEELAKEEEANAQPGTD